MATLPDTIHEQIERQFSTQIAKGLQDFGCVYGSSTYSPEKTTSDIDMFFVSEEASTTMIATITDFIKALHAEHGRSLDEEVPFENKVLYTRAEMTDATNLGGLEITPRKIVVPPVVKSAEFLGSAAIKARLAVNALTTPHVVFGTDLRYYAKCRDRAEDAITLVSLAQTDSDDELSVDQLHATLTTDSSGNAGEMFLGYKTEYPVVTTYLTGVLDNGLQRLCAQGAVTKTTNGYHLAKEVDLTKYFGEQ